MKTGSKQICNRSIYDGHPNLSQSVYKDTRETELFCRMLNYLFDCMNTRNLYDTKITEMMLYYFILPKMIHDWRYSLINKIVYNYYVNNSGWKTLFWDILKIGKNISLQRKNCLQINVKGLCCRHRHWKD